MSTSHSHEGMPQVPSGFEQRGGLYVPQGFAAPDEVLDPNVGVEAAHDEVVAAEREEVSAVIRQHNAEARREAEALEERRRMQQLELLKRRSRGIEPGIMPIPPAKPHTGAKPTELISEGPYKRGKRTTGGRLFRRRRA